MSTIERTASYPGAKRYWRMVTETVEQVFHTSSDAVSPLRKEINNCPKEERLLFYHAEPLDVAADLAGQRSGPQHIEAYLALAERLKWKPKPLRRQKPES